MQEKEFEPMSKELEENELESVVGGSMDQPFNYYPKTHFGGNDSDGTLL